MSKNRRRVLLLNLLLDEVSASTVLCARSFVPVVMYHTHPVRSIHEMRGSDGRLKSTLFFGGGVMLCFVVPVYQTTRRHIPDNCDRSHLLYRFIYLSLRHLTMLLIA